MSRVFLGPANSTEGEDSAGVMLRRTARRKRLTAFPAVLLVHGLPDDFLTISGRAKVLARRAREP